jgi:putative transposase
MIQAAEELAVSLGAKLACEALGVPRSSLYRRRRPPVERKPKPRPTPARALSSAEKGQVRDVLNSERFRDRAPREVYASLLDEGLYHCCWRTMYRILAEQAQVRERRNQLRHPAYAKPELMATAPNQVWSWDITKLRGPWKGVYYYLYVILDIFSRYVVGWMMAEREVATLAEQLIGETCTKQGIDRGSLTIHADNGSAMTSKSLAVLLADLGVAKSHSRPHVSNDNPFSEAQMKTLKYHPSYPDRFGCLLDARAWGRDFFDWYNNEHHHTSLALLTPADVHCGRSAVMLGKRQAVLQQAYEAHPERFVRGAPKPLDLPAAVWINPPVSDEAPSAAAERPAPVEAVYS